MPANEKYKILLLQQDPVLAGVYRDKFKAAGFETDAVHRAEHVFERINNNKYHAAILENFGAEQNPNSGAISILKKIRGGEKSHHIAGLIVIILSNAPNDMEIEQSLLFGASDYIVKAHASPAEIVERLIKHLR